MASKRKQTLQVVPPQARGWISGRRAARRASSRGHAFGAARSAVSDELEDWRRGWNRAVEAVAMEATGVYWIPVYEVLDRAGFEVHLVDARATKQVSGRKSDVRDCQCDSRVDELRTAANRVSPEGRGLWVRSYRGSPGSRTSAMRPAHRR